MMTNKQLDEIFKIETQVLIKIDFDGALNELAYLYSQYKDAV